MLNYTYHEVGIEMEVIHGMNEGPRVPPYFWLFSRCGDLWSSVVFTQVFHPVTTQPLSLLLRSVFWENSPLSVHRHLDISLSMLHIFPIRGTEQLMILALDFDFVSRNLGSVPLSCVADKKFPFPHVVLLTKIWKMNTILPKFRHVIRKGPSL